MAAAPGVYIQYVAWKIAKDWSSQAGCAQVQSCISNEQSTVGLSPVRHLQSPQFLHTGRPVADLSSVDTIVRPAAHPGATVYVMRSSTMPAFVMWMQPWVECYLGRPIDLDVLMIRLRPDLISIPISCTKYLVIYRKLKPLSLGTCCRHMLVMCQPTRLVPIYATLYYINIPSTQTKCRLNQMPVPTALHMHGHTRDRFSSSELLLQAHSTKCMFVKRK